MNDKECFKKNGVSTTLLLHHNDLTQTVFQAILDAIPISVYWKHRDGSYGGCNQYMLKMGGLSDISEIIGKKDNELKWADIAPELAEVDNDVMQNRKVFRLEEHPLIANGQKKTFLTTKSPLFNENNEVIGLIGISIDITDQKAAELREREALVQAAAAEERAQAAEEKINAAKFLAATVAHELRTPLGSIKGAASGIKNYLPTLLKGYEIAEKTQDPDLPLIRPSQIEILKKSLTSIEKETAASNLIINMLLTNLSANQLELQEFSLLSINGCITKALERYPIPDDMRHKIHWEPEEDFLFKGSELLTEHVLFNLLKNALYHIRAADHGDIYITVNTKTDKNIVLFKDTGTGIDAEDLPNIFTPFFSKTRHGTGVGLAFCKSVMKLYGGDITCRSEKNSYAEFILSFPKGVEK